MGLFRIYHEYNARANSSCPFMLQEKEPHQRTVKTSQMIPHRYWKHTVCPSPRPTKSRTEARKTRPKTATHPIHHTDIDLITNNTQTHGTQYFETAIFGTLIKLEGWHLLLKYLSHGDWFYSLWRVVGHSLPNAQTEQLIPWVVPIPSPQSIQSAS